MKINVKGPSRTSDLKPLWEAKVEVVKLNQPKDHRAIRNLFISRSAPIVNGVPLNVGGNPLLPPGVMLALCRVETVKIRLGNKDYGWTDHGQSLAHPSLLLLQAPPEAWSSSGTQLKFPDCVCIGGEIALDLLDLNENQEDWRQHFSNLTNADHIVLHGSGLSLAGDTTLAWEDAPLDGLFHVTLPFTDAPVPSGTTLRMALDRERMSAAMMSRFAAAFQRLAADLLPAVPERPSWVGLELSQNTAVPKFHWDLTPVSNGAVFKLERNEAQLLLSDQALGEDGVLPRSLSRSAPAEVAILRQGNQLQLKINSGPTPANVTGKFVYAANRSGGSWAESVTLSNIVAGYDALAVAGELRLRDGLAEPDPLDKISPTVLWGFAPLEDGWAQLPFLNLTEQLYLDVFNPQQEKESEALLLGAVSIGNDSPELGKLKPGDQSWSVTLLDAAHYEGIWTLNRAAGQPRWTLQTIQLTVDEPEVALNGFLWLATGAPSIADALPNLDNFLAGLQMVPLRSLRPQEMFPSAFLLTFSKVVFNNSQPIADSSLSYPQLQTWEYRYEANRQLHQGQIGLPVFDKLLERPKWGDKNIFRDLPLVWRRHPNLPAIQSLPMTQNQSPPNYPSPSRQLAPFELPTKTSAGIIVPGEWRFGAASASEWPQMLNPQAALPAGEWKSADGLWLAALSVPGLVFDANTDATLTSSASGFLPAQYKFGLPATDELNALAQLPKENKLDKAANREVPAEPPRLPLVREAYRQHWSVLSEKAFLARHDADDALASNGASTVVRNLVEPFDWPVKAALSENEYPGSLTLEENGQKLELKTTSALRGIEGNFTETGGKLKLVDGDSAEFSVISGSMLMRSADGRARDQRGLHRSSTEPIAPNPPGKLLKTRVQLEGKPEVSLCSLLEPMELKVGDSTWRLWFRDVPVQGTVFDRNQTRSGQARGVNDPVANSREFAHLTGYEWRLADAGNADVIRLHAFDFHPLTLEKVELTNDAVSAVEMTGRLQLPAEKSAEQIDLNNAVRVRFAVQAGALKLSTIQAAAPEPDQDSTTAVPMIPVEWPLEENEFTPLLTWQTVSYNAANGEITLTDARLSFSLFGARWTLPPKQLIFPAASSTVTLSYAAADLEPPLELAVNVKEVKLTLALSELNKSDLAVVLNFQWGSQEQMNLQATATVHLIGEKTGTKEFTASLVHGTAQLPLDSAGATFSLLPAAIQLPFKVSTPASQSEQQLLPGMHLSAVEAVNGFAVMSVAVGERDGGTPKLSLRAAFMEAILPCEWGLQLHEAKLGQNAGQEVERVFGSSAGRLYAGFALRHTRGNSGQPNWNPSLLFNGFLEIKNLISWPSQLVPSQLGEDSTTLTLPAARPEGDDPPLNHLRHSMRVLFNQHEAPMKALKAGTGKLLFDFAEGKSWQFLAVVEHQLIEVETGAADRPLSVKSLRNDRRWMAAQEVRFLRPAQFSALLDSFQQKKFVSFDGSRELAATSLTLANLGFQREELINRLLSGPRGDEFARLKETLLVEASAPHWIRVKENTAGQFTNLQYLPRGTQRAILSTPEDFASRDAAEKAWLLLSLPVLGRLQSQEKDQLGAASISTDDSLLQVDPIVYLHRQRLAGPQAKFETVPLALSSWEDAEDRTFNVSEFDLAQRRLFGRLDPATLEESWFRLQNPPVEAVGTLLPSVLAALPTDSPGRSSRQAMLRSLANAFRPGLPPREPNADDPSLDEIGPDQELIWRRDSLFVMQAVGKDLNKFHYSFALTGAQFLTAPFIAAADRTTRHSAATLLPSSLRISDKPNPQPVSFAVSPYLSVDYAELTGQTAQSTLRLTVGELLCLNPSGADLGSVVSQVWGEETGTAEAIENWGREVHDRLAVDSPIAVVRVRKVKEFGASANVAVEYEFHVLTVQPPVSPARRAKPVRVRLEGLRFVEGQFGGKALPEQIANFELAPPQLRGVQPIYLDDRPGNADPANRQWNWGLSGLRLSVEQTEGQAGLAGKIPTFPSKTAFRLWWQANRHEVQFALPGKGSARRLLPRRFRSQAIKNLLPALPNVPLPTGADLKLTDSGVPLPLDARLSTWQPMMSGAFRTLILGARAGAPFLLNQHLLCQQTGGDGNDMVFASSSTPVQHRMPRPVALPPNRKNLEEVALKPWASFFAPESNSRITGDPADNAFISAAQKLGLEMRLAEPSGGVIPQGIGNDLFFELKTASGKDPLAEWEIGLELVLEARRIVYKPNAAQPKKGELYRFSTTDADAGKLIGGLAHGTEIYAEAKVKPKQEGKVKNYRQTLHFPLRLARADEARLPLRPTFTQFEDPEYNRRLASVTARSTAATSVGDKRYEVTLSADRREYNANSQMFVVFFGDTIPTVTSNSLKLERVDSNGVKRSLLTLNNVAQSELISFDLGKLAEERGFAFSTGDTLLMTLTLKNASGPIVELSLGVQIVARPVVPTPGAGYALLRRMKLASGDVVECARFAWAPQASRIELINPDDLTGEIVRRRAVFQWQATARTERPNAFEVQKLTFSGSTHFPALVLDSGKQ